MQPSNHCASCMYFSSLHECCSSRITVQNGITAYLHRKSNSPACSDINKPDLRDFLTTQRINEVIPMTDNDDRDWQGLPVLQVFCQSGGLRIVGTVDGLGDLLTAIARAMGQGNSSVELLSSDSEVYPVMVDRRDLASEWDNLPPPVLNPEPFDDKPISEDDLDGLDFRESF